MIQAKKITEQKITAASLLILTVITITATLMHLKVVMVPFVLSIFLFFMISPSTDYLQVRLKIPRFVAVGCTLLIGLVFATILIIIVSDSIQSLVQNIDIYEARAADVVVVVAQYLDRLGVETDLDYLQSQIRASQVFGFIRNFTSEFFGLLGNISLIFIFLMFLLLGARPGNGQGFLAEINLKISKYIWTKFAVSFATGLLVGVSLALIGVELAFMFGVLAFLLNFIPSIGSILSTLLPLPLALLQFGFGTHFALTLLIPGSIQVVIGNVLEPKLMGENLDLHPVTIMFFLLFWGIVWGVPGMFLAVPITAIIKFVLEQFPSSRFVAEILAGRLPEGS